MQRRVIALCALLLATAACSDDESTDSTSVTTAAPGTLAPGATSLTGESLAPQTTFMPDCSQMPSAATLSAQVGVPLDEGQVTGAGTCEFLGVNDQSLSVVLSLFTDPAEQAAFLDLQASLGASTPLNDAALAGALVSPNSLLYITANNTTYAVQVMVTGGTPAEQLPLAAAVLTAWLAL